MRGRLAALAWYAALLAALAWYAALLLVVFTVTSPVVLVVAAVLSRLGD